MDDQANPRAGTTSGHYRACHGSDEQGSASPKRRMVQVSESSEQMQLGDSAPVAGAAESGGMALGSPGRREGSASTSASAVAETLGARGIGPDPC